MQARFYLPMYGRFASPDPARDQHFEETQSWNIYSYVQNNPVMKIDPTGMWEWPAWMQKVSSLAAYGKWQTFDENAKNVVYSQTSVGPDGKRQIDTTWGLNVNGEHIKQYDHKALQVDAAGSFLFVQAGAAALTKLSSAVESKLATGASSAGMEGPSPLINSGAQGKHIPGHNNFQAGKSELTANAQELGRYAGTGKSANGIQAGIPGAKERVGFGKVIGNYVDPVTKAKIPTQNGIIHYSKRGIHIVPSRPN